MNEHPRTRAIEAFAAGEQPDGVADHLEACDRCRGLVAGIAHERERLLARSPAAAFVAQVKLRREAGQRRARRRWFAWGSGLSGLGLAAAAALLLVPRLDGSARLDGAPRPVAPTQGPGAGAGVRLKGTGVEVFRRRDEQVERLTDEARVRAGDGLRIAVTLPAAESVSVWFVDAQGRVDRFPEAQPLALGAGENLLPGAVVVDEPCVDLHLVVRTRAGELVRSLRCE